MDMNPGTSRQPSTSAPGAPAVVPAAAGPASQATSVDLDERHAALQAILRATPRLLVAFSGGVDSAYLLYAAVEALGAGRVVAATGVSASLAQRELEEARALAARLGVDHRLVETREIDSPGYVANAPDRCYFCKSELFARLHELAAVTRCDTIADGTNADDEGDIRPGRRAARERGVTSPLLEARLTKADIRELSRRAGLPTWDKPEMACLASRVPFGTVVDAEKLRQIDAAEEGLRRCGVRGGRVRHHGDVARVELPGAELARLGDAGFRTALVEAVRAAGFAFVAVDLEGYRRGRMHTAGTPQVIWRSEPQSGS
jgi:pyridinium-3,5-biscarboxylic acid mononucleotide sulfurtransferase